MLFSVSRICLYLNLTFLKLVNMVNMVDVKVTVVIHNATNF